MIDIFYSRSLQFQTSFYLMLKQGGPVYYDDNPGPGPGPETAAAVVTLAQLPAASGPSFLSSS